MERLRLVPGLLRKILTGLSPKEQEDRLRDRKDLREQQNDKAQKKAAENRRRDGPDR